MPAGGFKKAFGEHEINYKLMKGDADDKIAKRRTQERNSMKDHYGSLKFKPKKPIENPYGRVEQPLSY